MAGRRATKSEAVDSAGFCLIWQRRSVEGRSPPADDLCPGDIGHQGHRSHPGTNYTLTHSIREEGLFIYLFIHLFILWGNKGVTKLS